MCLAFAGLSGLGLASRARVALDRRGVTYRTRLGVHRIDWDEVRRVETDGVTLVLVGAAKQLPVAPRFWAPASRPAAQAYLERALARRGVPHVDNPTASRMAFRNTRVRAPRPG